jgi:uncharacterized membrane protein YphA (DoxX/SURF4 family)
MTRPSLRTTAYWLTTILGPASFLMGGFLGVTRDPQMLATLHHLGYPDYFATISGTWKILGALAVVAPGLPRLKEWAYAGFFFELTAAAASRAFVGDGLGDILAPLAFLSLVAASWALRPANRRLAAPARHDVRAEGPVTRGMLALGTR